MRPSRQPDSRPSSLHPPSRPHPGPPRRARVCLLYLCHSAFSCDLHRQCFIEEIESDEDEAAAQDLDEKVSVAAPFFLQLRFSLLGVLAQTSAGMRRLVVEEED